jgi:hypothetical protein
MRTFVSSTGVTTGTIATRSLPAQRCEAGGVQRETGLTARPWEADSYHVKDPDILGHTKGKVGDALPSKSAKGLDGDKATQDMCAMDLNSLDDEQFDDWIEAWWSRYATGWSHWRPRKPPIC